MSMFGGSNKKEVPGISSGSLSDIVFRLLFFFMVTTQMRETENKVQVKLPEASEVTKLERKDLSSYISSGSSMGCVWTFPLHGLYIHVAMPGLWA